ncbi:Uncharacterised protein [Raoultella terrigena]|uniref:Uncharacterized protein n=1 Tax=Raoultella terrigena TaxID=577 RepID=A0A3P8J345_RAOTE|nr:Uncharacterised protein [Raoultella terrigena]
MQEAVTPPATEQRAGSFPLLSVLERELAKGLQRLLAHVMLHPFGIATGDLRADADHQQEVFHNLMPFAALVRQLLAFRG